jgi:Zn-finger nucleic acid-binding protein
MTERQGVEIDYCPKCRGVWLDRGELDKIIETSAGALRAGMPAPGQREPAHGRRDDDDDDHRRYEDHDSRRERRKGLLGELFDF